MTYHLLPFSKRHKNVKLNVIVDDVTFYRYNSPLGVNDSPSRFQPDEYPLIVYFYHASRVADVYFIARDKTMIKIGGTFFTVADAARAGMRFAPRLTTDTLTGLLHDIVSHPANGTGVTLISHGDAKKWFAKVGLDIYDGDTPDAAVRALATSMGIKS